MDCKIISRLFFLIILFTTTQLNAIEFKGKFLQGHFIVGITEPEAKIIIDKKEIKVFYSSRYKTKNTHGTGCTLSSAITTLFSCGKSLKKACELGIKYVNSAILTNPNYGKGYGPINHLNSINLKKKFN